MELNPEFVQAYSWKDEGRRTAVFTLAKGVSIYKALPTIVTLGQIKTLDALPPHHGQERVKITFEKEAEVVIQPNPTDEVEAAQPATPTPSTAPLPEEHGSWAGDTSEETTQPDINPPTTSREERTKPPVLSFIWESTNPLEAKATLARPIAKEQAKSLLSTFGVIDQLTILEREEAYLVVRVEYLERRQEEESPPRP